MRTETLAQLVSAEYGLTVAVGDLSDAAALLRRSGLRGSAAASRDLLLARGLIDTALRRIGGPLAEAAALHEAAGLGDGG